MSKNVKMGIQFVNIDMEITWPQIIWTSSQIVRCMSNLSACDKLYNLELTRRQFLNMYVVQYIVCTFSVHQTRKWCTSTENIHLYLKRSMHFNKLEVWRILSSLRTWKVWSSLLKTCVLLVLGFFIYPVLKFHTSFISLWMYSSSA